MKTYEIYKTFNTHEECEKWKDENCPNRTYNGEMVFMINHEESWGSNEITITTIMTI